MEWGLDGRRTVIIECSRSKKLEKRDVDFLSSKESILKKTITYMVSDTKERL